jgi:hypothetical protein
MPKWLRIAGISAAGVFALGYGAMNALQRFLPSSPGLRNLSSYASASWGDGLVLPLLTGCLIGTAKQLAPARRELTHALIWGLLGAATGAATQYLWLQDPAPGLNWTLPAARRFNAAGWYHAAFTVGTLGLLIGTTALVQRRLVQVSHPWPSRVRWHLGTVGVLVLIFGALVAWDNVQKPITDSQSTTLFAMLAGLSLLAPLALWVHKVGR